MVRKTRKQRKTKKIWGGNINQPGQKQIQQQIQIQPEQIQNQEQIEPPGVKDNVKKALDIGLQLGDNVAALGLEKLEDGVKNFSESIGIDTNKSVKQEITKIGKKAEEIQQALNTPEGRKAVQSATKLLSDISEDIIAPAVETGVSQVIDHSGPIITKGQNALFDIVSASPFGPLFDIPKLGSDVLGVVENTAAMASDISETAEETLGKVKDKENEIKSVWSNLENVVTKSTGNMNSGLSSGLTNIKNRVDNYGKEIVKQSKNATDTLKNVHKEGVKIGGRINKSKLEFLTPSINKTKILKQYGGNKWKTKKYRYK
jgi:hypothetical protein